MTGNRQWYRLEKEEAVQELNTDLREGLSEEEAVRRLKEFGSNGLEEAPGPGLFSLLLGQFSEALVLVLLAAALISGLLGETTDAVVIMVIVVLNAILGAVQEFKAEQSLKALQKLTLPRAKVVREGQVAEISSKNLVPGDMVLLEAGDFVPADARLMDAFLLQVDESPLTGESVPVEKEPSVPEMGELPVSEQRNMVFMGTTVTGGRGRALVVETGVRSQLGRVAQLLAASPLEPTPLQRRLSRLGKTLGLAALFLVTLVFVTGLLRGEGGLEMFMTAVSLAVAVVPEGLPAVVTIVLALGVTRMSRRQAIVRKLPAVETLGTATTICSDKTGTLTKNEMTVTSLYTWGSPILVTGEGYLTEGTFLAPEGREVLPQHHPNLKLLLLGGLLNNDASLAVEGEEYRVIGDPTEGALKVAALKAGLEKEGEGAWGRLEEIPFSPDRKLMTTFHRQPEGGVISFTKGAPDFLLDRCARLLQKDGEEPLTQEAREELVQVNAGLAAQGKRVLGLAYRHWTELPAKLPPDTVEDDLTFVGYFALQDPARGETKDAVQLCRRAGIRPVMITGDHKATALAIARDLEIWQPGDQILTGQELDGMDNREMREAVGATAVYARVSPEHKLKIVSALKEEGQVVAMTGDGVNDAPALKRAHIGVAMGITGTEVAKQAADMVLLDDNFATIVAAVREGRTIYNNIVKTVQYLLSCNTGEIIAIFGAIAAGLGSPLSPLQILWLNLVTDGAPALALGLEPPEHGVMDRPPRSPDAGILAGGTGGTILWQGVLMGLLALAAYWLPLEAGRTVEEARTMAFMTLAFTQLFHAFNVKSRVHSLFTTGLAGNPGLLGAFTLSAGLQAGVAFIPWAQDIFGTVPLAAGDWLLIAAFSLVPLVVVEGIKLVKRIF